MSRGFSVKVARKRVVFPVVMLVVGLLSLAGAQGALACLGGYVTGLLHVDKDTYVCEGTPPTAHGNEGFMTVGYNQTHDQWRAYIHFPVSGLPDVPAGCTPLAAYVDYTARVVSNDSGFTGPDDIQDANIQARRTSATWPENITWNSKPGTAGNYTTSNPQYPGDPSLQGWWDVTAPVLDYDGVTNNGIEFKPVGSGWTPLNGVWWSPMTLEGDGGPYFPLLVRVYYA
jgi:hypothetical protein